MQQELYASTATAQRQHFETLVKWHAGYQGSLVAIMMRMI
jgi:hypothetical protein